MGGHVETGELVFDVDPPKEYLIGVGTYGEIFMEQEDANTVQKRIYYNATNYKQVRAEAIT